MFSVTIILYLWRFHVLFFHAVGFCFVCKSYFSFILFIGAVFLLNINFIKSTMTNVTRLYIYQYTLYYRVAFLCPHLKVGHSVRTDNELFSQQSAHLQSPPITFWMLTRCLEDIKLNTQRLHRVNVQIEFRICVPSGVDCMAGSFVNPNLKTHDIHEHFDPST